MALTKHQLADLERVLRRRCVALVEEIGAHAKDRAAVPSAIQSGGMDRADVAVAVQIADVSNAEALRDIRELGEVEAALSRLAGGHFGHCIDCEKAIDAARLYAQPAALRCLACQKRYDGTHARSATSAL
jgi:RNA polymerase-binding transcription factor DksA